MMSIHSEQRWYWALAGKDLLTSLGQALEVYRMRHGQFPDVVWVNPRTAEKLQAPAGIELAVDGYLPRIMVAMSLPSPAPVQAVLL